MSALPLPNVQSLAAADATRSLPPAPAAATDQAPSRSFAAALERHADRYDDATDPVQSPDEPQTKADTAARTTTGDQTPTDRDDGGAVSAPAIASGSTPIEEPIVAAEQATLAALLGQTIAVVAPLQAEVATPVIGDVGIALQTAVPPLPTAGLGTGPALMAAPVVDTTTAMPVATTAATSTVVSGAVSLTSETVQAAPASDTAATAPAASLAVAQDILAAQAAVSAPTATTTAIDSVATGAISAQAPTVAAGSMKASLPTAATEPALDATTSAPTMPATSEQASSPVTTAIDITVVATAAAASTTTVVSPATVPATTATEEVPTSTAVPQALPTATTGAMQATAQQLHTGKQTQAVPEESPQKIAADKAAPEAQTAATITAPTTPTQSRPVSFEQVLTASTTTNPPNAMDKVVAQQVNRAIIQNLPNGDRMLTLRLTPPELGTVRIEVVERQGMLSARLHAEDDGVRLALEKALPSMRQELRASDAPVRDVQVGDQSRFDQAHSQQQGQGDAGRNGRQRNEDEPAFSIDGAAPVRERPRTTARPLGGRADSRGVDALA